MSSFLGVVLAETQAENERADRDHAKNASFQHPWIDHSSQIRLLNVEHTDASTSTIACTLGIADVSDLPESDYATLSYCWGQATADEDIHSIVVDNQPFWVRTNLFDFFRTIKDLDVHTPIYIDAICLNQLDNVERGEQVKLMSSVYSNANHTHVWLGSPHPDQELYLKTLRGQLSSNPPESPWQEESFIGLSFLFSRNYWGRLWIVQELLLSKGITLHCGTSSYTWDELLRLAKMPLANTFFDAPENADWWDAWHFPRPKASSLSRKIQDRLYHGWQTALRLIHHRNEWLSRARVVLQFDAFNQRRTGFPFHQALPAFKSQRCGDPKDKVYALIGLLDDDGRDMISPDYQSSLPDVFVEAAAALIVSSWRAEAGSNDVQSFKYNSRINCDMLNKTLGLPDDDLEIRVSKAFQIAVSYDNDLPNSISSNASENGEHTMNGLSYAIQEDLPVELQHTMLGFEPGPVEPPLRQSLEMLKHELTNTGMQEFALTKLSELNITIAAIQNKQRATGTLQNMTRLSAFLDVVEQYAEMLDQCAGASNVASVIWGSMRFLLQSTIRKNEAFDGLLSQYERLGECLPALMHVQALPTARHDRQSELVGVVFRNVFEFHRLALQYFKKPAWWQLFSTSWTKLQKRFEGFFSDIHEHKTLVESQANAQELGEARQGREDNRDRFSELMEQARQAKAIAEENLRKLDAAEVERRRTYLFNWLCAPDTTSDHDHLRQATVEQTPASGSWLLSNNRFRAWYDPSSVSTSLLWVTGQPGAGKSVLASLVIEEAKKLEHTTTLFFYCKHDDPDKTSFLGMARSILGQLLLNDETLLMYMFDIATKKGETSLRTVTMAKEMLTACLKAVGKAYVIIDGIDECQPGEQQRIAKFWMDHVEKSGSEAEPSRCALFGQDDATTRPLLCRLPIIRIQGERHDNDIRSYCMATAEKLHERFGLTPYEMSHIVSETARRAQGMFLFAKLVMRNLSQQATKGELLGEVQPDIFPRDLNNAYDRIMDRILTKTPDPLQKHVTRLLAWTACAVRVLKWREIQAAVSIDFARQVVDFDTHQLRVDSKTLCGALIEELPNGDVTFVHSTVRPYLIKYGYVKPEFEHAELAQLCLNYLALPAFSTTWPDNDVRSAILEGTYAFVEYAMISWTAHLEEVLNLLTDNVLPARLTEALETFFSLHWKEPRKRSKATKRITELTNQLDAIPIYDKVKDSMSSMHCLMSTNLSDLEAVQTSDIFSALARVRSLMEGMALQSDMVERLEGFYGKQLYRCPRVYCKWFHEGFSKGDKRQSHVDKHERSHYCSSLGCVYATFGFPTAKELAKHIADVHNTGPTEEDFPAIIEESDEPEDTDTVMEDAQPAEQAAAPERVERRNAFRAVNEETADKQQNKEPSEPSRRRRKGPSTYECDRCHKRFTRAFGLRSHMKTHADILEFECTVCNKKFARQRDCKRHEEAHSGEKKFVCQGDLKKGGTWGCLRRFARGDALGRHFRSEAGRNCIRPLLDEARESQNSMDTLQQPRDDFGANERSHTTNTLPELTDAYDYFPATLQQQYPDLSNSSWAYPPLNNNMDPNARHSPFPAFGEPSSSAGSTAYHDQNMDYGDYDLPSSSSNERSTSFRRSNYLDDFEGR